MNAQRQRGLTFIELIIAIVVIGVSVAGVLSVMTRTVQSSADPMIQQQAIAIAEAYLEEILIKAYADPDGIDGEGARPLFDDVDDYHGLVDDGPRDQFGTALGLPEYVVRVSVAAEAVSGVAAQRVDVSVTHTTGAGVVLSGHRADW